MVNTDLRNLFSGTAEALWQLGKEKNSMAWSKIVKMHSVGMFHTAKGVLGDHFLAEDAVQNAFLQIRDLSAEYFRREIDEKSKGIFNLHKENAIFKNDFAARNWIIRITYFVAKDMKKSRVSTKEREKVFTQNWVEERESRLAPDQELLSMLQTEIEKLPEELRMPLVLRFHCDLSFNQVSSELGLAVHIIRKRVEKGIEVLQTRISAIVGSSMPTASIESLLKNVFTLKDGLFDSLVMRCVGLLDKPVLTKLQLVPENKLLLQSTKFMVKGLVMLKVLSVLVILGFTVVFTVNSIQSNESREGKSRNEKEFSLKEIENKDKNNTKKEIGVNKTNSNRLAAEPDVIVSDNVNAITSPVSKRFDINEILPYFSEKAMFTLIMPDIKKSIEKFKTSSASKFYGNSSVDLLGKIPLILKSYFNMDLEPVSSDIYKTIFEKITTYFYCVGGQFSVDINSKKKSFFVIGILKDDSEESYNLILEAIRPFQKEVKKLSNGATASIYQVSEKLPSFQIIKFENKVILGNSDGSWVSPLDIKDSASFVNKKHLISDIFWNFNLYAFSEYVNSVTSEEISKDNKTVYEPLGLNLLKINGEVNILKNNFSHKIEIPFIAFDNKKIWDVIVFKKISNSMLEQIPAERKAFLCLNIDLVNSWNNYNSFMDSYLDLVIKNGDENYGQIKNEYKVEYEKYEEMCKVALQMSLNELATKVLTGELISWITSNPHPMQTIRLGIKDVELANKIVAGLISIVGKESGITVNLNGKYIDIKLPISKDIINENFQSISIEEKTGSLRSNLEIINMNYYSWLDNSFSVNQSTNLLWFKFLNQSQFNRNNTLHNDLNLQNLFCSSITNSETSFSISKEKLSLEFKGLDDIVQLLTGGEILNKKYGGIKDVNGVYTEIKEKISYNGKLTEYVSQKGYLLNGEKVGRWTFYNYKGELSGEGEFKNNKETGFWKKTDREGNIGEGEMIDGLENGQWKILHYYWKNPSYGEMKLGRKVGIWKAYHNKNKKLAEEGEYVDGKKVGVWRHYHDNEAKEWEENYNKNGLLDGMRMIWDEEGNILNEEKYINGEIKAGKKFHKTKLIHEEVYEKEENFLLWSKTYHESNLSLQKEYRFDKENGMEFFKEYYPNGQVKLSTQNIVSIKDGKRENKSPIPTGEWKEWYENNTPKMIANFDKEGNGQKYFYYEDGRKILEYKLEKGLVNGAVSAWYDNGNFFFSGNYQNGVLNGNLTIWYLDGKKKAEGEFKNGKITSSWSLWDKTGELKREIEFNPIEAAFSEKKRYEYESNISRFCEELLYIRYHVDKLIEMVFHFKKENSIESK